MSNGIQIFSNSAFGIYIPSHFAQSVNRECIVELARWKKGLNFIANEDNIELDNYYDVWSDMLNHIELKDNNGNLWTLYQDGDLFMVCYEMMTMEEKRNLFGIGEYGREELAGTLFDVPPWINQYITLGTMESIVEGGCASGAYMPAVTYHIANETMAAHGNDVLNYIQETLGDVPMPNAEESWQGMAVHFLSIAIELWASQIDGIELVG